MTRSNLVVTLLLTFIIGALVGTIFGFVTFLRSPQARYAADFSDWLEQPIQLGWWPWPIFGGLIISLLYVILRLSPVARSAAINQKHGLSDINPDPISESVGADATKLSQKRQEIAKNEVRCPSCGTLNRVPNYFVSRIPSCGKCHKVLPEQPAKKIFRQIYRFSWAGFFLCIVLLIWHPWTSNFTSHAPSSISAPQKSIPQDTCSLRPQPRQGIYGRYTELPRVAPLEIRTSPSFNYFVKLEDAANGNLVMSFFIRGGSTLEENVPFGSFILKYAIGKSWCGDRDLFGSNTYTEKAGQILTFKPENTKNGYIAKGHKIELIPQQGGNLLTIPISRDEF